MDLGARLAIKTTLLAFALSGYLVLEVSSEKIINTDGWKFPNSYRSITGHLHLLRECRRQLTFIASMALGAFITRIIKDSPLTPVPLPPLKDPPRWTFLTLPLHASVPYMKWMESYVVKPQHHYKDFDPDPSSWRLRESDNSIDTVGWKGRRRFRRDVFRMLKPSPNFIANAVMRTLKSVQSLLSADDLTRQWLLRWCH